MFNEVIYLINEAVTINEYGDQVTSETKRPVFAAVKSIGQNEYYQAQAVGLKLEIKFIIADYLDYQDEKIIEYTAYNGEEKRYTVLRTYRVDNSLEIVVKRGVE